MEVIVLRGGNAALSRHGKLCPGRIARWVRAGRGQDRRGVIVAVGLESQLGHETASPPGEIYSKVRARLVRFFLSIISRNYQSGGYREE